jgi:hypothetical protein
LIVLAGARVYWNSLDTPFSGTTIAVVTNQTIRDLWPRGGVAATRGDAKELASAGQQDMAVAQLREAARDHELAQLALGVELTAAGNQDGAIEALGTFVADPADARPIPARLLRQAPFR